MTTVPLTLYQVQTTVGQSLQLPTFYLDAQVQGIQDVEHAERIARDIVLGVAHAVPASVAPRISVMAIHYDVQPPVTEPAVEPPTPVRGVIADGVVGYVTGLRRLPNIGGNPRWDVTIEDPHAGTRIALAVKPGSQLSYAIENPEYRSIAHAYDSKLGQIRNATPVPYWIEINGRRRRFADIRTARDAAEAIRLETGTVVGIQQETV